MNELRGRPTALGTWMVLGGAAWTVLVTAVLFAVPLAMREELPDPLATHWGFSGVADGSTSLTGFWIFLVALWTVAVAVAFVFALRGGLRRRWNRVWLCATLTGGAVFVVGIMALTMWANAGVEHWRQARSLSWQAFLAVGAAALVSLVTARLANRGPDEEAPPGGGSSRELRLRADERAVWGSSVSGRVLLGITFAGLVVTAAMAVATAFLATGPAWSGPIVPAVCALVCGMLSSVRVQVGEPGVRIAFGPLRWPVRALALERIASAAAVRKHPMEVGG